MLAPTCHIIDENATQVPMCHIVGFGIEKVLLEKYNGILYSENFVSYHEFGMDGGVSAYIIRIKSKNIVSINFYGDYVEAANYFDTNSMTASEMMDEIIRSNSTRLIFDYCDPNLLDRIVEYIRTFLLLGPTVSKLSIPKQTNKTRIIDTAAQTQAREEMWASLGKTLPLVYRNRFK